ncbi:MAG: imidazolonepropionase-like amidohydrolase [Woeseiaceae bacterium]|jgi:imidazolonepropionase-like amidohydrolase
MKVMDNIKLLKILAWSILSLAMPTSVFAGDDKADSWVLVHAGTLLAVPGQQPETEKTIVIKNGVIESVLNGFVPAADTAAVDAEVVSLKDRFVLPGLMDMHVHLSFDATSGAARKYDDADMAVTAVSSGQKMLMAGFTTVRDTASSGPAMFSVREGINKGRISGPRIFAAGMAISPTAGHGDHMLDNRVEQLFCDGPYECRKMVRQQIRVGADFIKITASGGGSEDNGGPDDPAEMLDDEIRAVADVAHSMKRLVTAHAHGAAGINAALRNGVDSIEHGTFPDKESIRLYKQTGAILVPTLAYITGWDEEYLAGLSPEQQIRKQQFIDLQPKGVAMAYKAGVLIAAGTDFGGLIPHGDNARELIAYVDLAGMSEMDALVTATVNGAKLLRKEDVLGTLEPGKFADLIATKTSPLDDIKVLKDIPFVMKGGVVYKDE